jgi:hypothetical protein
MAAVIAVLVAVAAYPVEPVVVTEHIKTTDDMPELIRVKAMVQSAARPTEAKASTPIISKPTNLFIFITLSRIAKLLESRPSR